MQTTINAATLYAAIMAAAAVAPVEMDELTLRALPEWMHFNNATPWGFDGGLEFAEMDDCQDYNRKGYAAMYGVAACARDAMEAARAEIRAALNVSKTITFKTSDKGRMRVANIRARLENFAATVKANQSAFGGGIKPQKRAKPAQVWPAGAVKLVRELLQDGHHAEGLELATEKCGALFYACAPSMYNRNISTFMVLAPVDCAEIEGLVSGQHEQGHYVVFDKASGLAVSSDGREKTRANAIAAAVAKWESITPEKRAAALAKAHAAPVDQDQARAAWMAERGIVAPVDVEALHAAAMAEQEEAQAAARTTARREVEGKTWCWSAILETTADNLHGLDYRAINGNSTYTTHATRRARAAALRELAANDCQAWEARQAARAARRAAAVVDYATAAAAVASACEAAALDDAPALQAAPDAARELETVTSCEAASEAAASSGQAMGRATYQATHQAEPARLVSATTAPGARTITSASGWSAELTEEDGLHMLRFNNQAGGWTPDTAHATRRERAQALRTLAHNDQGGAWKPLDLPGTDADTPAQAQALTVAQYRAACANLEEINNHGQVVLLGALRTGNPAFINQARAINAQHHQEGGLSQELGQKRRELAQRVRAWLDQDTTPPTPAAPVASDASATDYTDTRETSGGLHDTPRDLENVASDATQEAPAAREFVGDATYSPEDNKLRLYPFARLDADVYARVKEYGFTWAAKQGLFVAPAWTPGRADLLQELCGDIGDEDKSMAERAEERADRFSGYQGKRTQDAAQAYQAAHAIGARFEMGQPILIGHHSERRARKDKERMDSSMRKAVQMWDTADYWQSRARAAVGHAAYKERPEVRARRIKTLEAAQRKSQREHDEAAKWLKLWTLCEAMTDTEAQAARALQIANVCWLHMPRKEGDREDFNQAPTAHTVLTNSYPNLYAPRTLAEVFAVAQKAYPRSMAHAERWIAHYGHRIAYEKAMLGESGGTVADKTGPEVGGAVRTIWAPRGGWATIHKVNKVSVTVMHSYSEGGRVFPQLIPFDKCRAIMTRAQVDAARAEGRLINETSLGFGLLDTPPTPAPTEPTDTTPEATPPAAPVATDYTDTRETSGQLHDTPRDLAPTPAKATKTTQAARPVLDLATVQAMREALLQGGAKTVIAPELYPTPPELAARMVELADIGPNAVILEPSAGTGVLLKALDTADGCTLHAVEINPTLCDTLRHDYPGRARVFQADFLSWTPPEGIQYDAVLMNPPFGKAADIDHIKHALTMLKPGGTLVAICAGGPRQEAALRPLVEQCGGLWERLPSGTFANAGTQVNTVLLTITTEARKMEDMTDYTDPRETSGQLHDTPRDLQNPPAFRRMVPVSVDLRHAIKDPLSPKSLVGMGVDYLGTDEKNPPGTGAIVEAFQDDLHGISVMVALEDGRVLKAVAADFGPKTGNFWRINFKMHGTPYLAQLVAAVATWRASTHAADTIAASKQEGNP